ncbi:MAG: hypothetical protein LBK65_00650, partial [Tannerellaceae bacterium]|nr:hypothetical protein [Tannerellaceae bacterium]
QGNIFMAMDRCYEDDETHRLVKYKGFEPVVPPKSNRLRPWEYYKERYKRRNRVCTRYDKLDIMFLNVLNLAFITDTFFCVNMP